VDEDLLEEVEVVVVVEAACDCGGEREEEVL